MSNHPRTLHVYRYNKHLALKKLSVVYAEDCADTHCVSRYSCIWGADIPRGVCAKILGNSDNLINLAEFLINTKIGNCLNE